MEEEKLRDEIQYIKNEVGACVFAQSTINKSIKGQEDQIVHMSNEF